MANTYTLLETITVGAAGASSVTFNSIPSSGYTDLVLKMSTRRTAAFADIQLRFNSDSGNNYSMRQFRGDGSGTSSSSSSAQNIGFVSNGANRSSYTANTFGNVEIYIPNAFGSTTKSYSVDSVNENNATQADAMLVAGLWSGTAGINSVTLFPDIGYGDFVQHSTFYLYGVSALGTTPTKAPKATGGSIIQTDGTYWYHAFLSSGTFTPATALSCDVLVVAGGGGGLQGGGGAGGVLGFASQSIGTSAQTVTVGGGGASNAAGSNSSFAALTASVGGAGGVGNDTNGATGGSGSGGGGSSTLTTTGGSGTSGQGNAGGGNGAFRSPFPGGGGGGSGAAGGNATSTSVTGSGGAGVSTVTNYGALSTTLTTLGLGVSGFIAGGGAGGSNGAGSGTGGSGGGASFSAAGAGSNGTAATANTGSGGSGGSGAGGIGGAGGSGLVIIRYLAA